MFKNYVDRNSCPFNVMPYELICANVYFEYTVHFVFAPVLFSNFLFSFNFSSDNARIDVQLILSFD